MTLTYRPTDALAARLDPRSKLLFQVAFAVAAFAHTTPRGLVVLTGIAGVVLASASLSPLAVLRGYRFVIPFLLAAPILEALALGPPWVVPGDAVGPLLASYRVLVVLAVSGAYVRTTPIRESRAAIQRTIPGRAGQFLGVGVGFVFRLLPVLSADLRSIRAASAARLGTERRLHERMALVGTAGLARAFDRADRFALALRARCFAWNPTLPALALSRMDVPVLAASAGLAAWAVV